MEAESRILKQSSEQWERQFSEPLRCLKMWACFSEERCPRADGSGERLNLYLISIINILLIFLIYVIVIIIIVFVFIIINTVISFVVIVIVIVIVIIIMIVIIILYCHIIDAVPQ